MSNKTPSDNTVSIKTRHEFIKTKIAEAIYAANRADNEVKLVAVSKNQSEEKINTLLRCGQQLFGENRVQEAKRKWTSLKVTHPNTRLHLIGPLQTNKVSQAVSLFDVIETLDRPKLAYRLAEEMSKQNRKLPCYVQVNLGEEKQKFGIPPANLDAFIDLCRNDLGFEIEGLMCIPPASDDPRIHFSTMRTLALRNNLSGLSMGMSADYESAITCGATLVRIGTAIFGKRDN